MDEKLTEIGINGTTYELVELDAISIAYCAIFKAKHVPYRVMR